MNSLPGARNGIQIYYTGAAAQAPPTSAFPGRLSASWSGSGAAGDCSQGRPTVPKTPVPIMYFYKAPGQ